MKKLNIVLIVLSIALLTACAAPAASVPSQAPGLIVSDGVTSKSYTRAELEKLAVSQSSFKDIAYKGVTIAVLLKDAGFDATTAKAVKATAGDGFSSNYDPAQVLADGVILAYARVDGDLTAEDGAFRMVLPNAEGKLNVRQLVSLQVVK